MAGVISKRELAALGKRERTGGFDKPTQPVKPTSAGVLVKNDSGSNISAGGLLSISGYASTLSVDIAKRRALNGEIVLKGTAAANASAATLATALEPIKAGAVGRCSIPVVFSPVSVTNANYTQVNANLTTVETGGVYQILAKSTTAAGVAFCALAKLTGGSGGGSSGHTYRLDTTSQNVLILPSDTLDVVTGLAVVGNSLTYTTTNIRIISSNSTTSVLKTATLVQTN
jgi:hypothetical protein